MLVTTWKLSDNEATGKHENQPSEDSFWGHQGRLPKKSGNHWFSIIQVSHQSNEWNDRNDPDEITMKRYLFRHEERQPTVLIASKGIREICATRWFHSKGHGQNQ